MKINHNNFMFFLIVTFVLCACVGCGKSYNSEKDAIGDLTSKKNNVTLHNEMISVDVLHSEKKTVKMKKLEELNIRQDDEYVQNNNNLVNGGDILPYQGGYFYNVEKMPYDGGNSMLVYDDGRGEVKECPKLSGNGVRLEYTLDDYVYYYDSEKSSLIRERGGQSERVIEFKYFGGSLRCYAEDGIYYTDIDEDKEESYIGKIGYDGTENRKLYKLNVAVDQVFKYQDDLWFVYYKFGSEKNRVGRIHLSNNKVFVYREILPEGSSEAGNLLSFNNGYLYYNSSGLNRLNIREDTLEQIYEDDVQAINFTENSIWFCTEKNLYKMNKDGVKKIMKLKGDTEGFCGIREDKGKIYIETYAGDLYHEFYQMDEAGKIVKHWDSEEASVVAVMENQLFYAEGMESISINEKELTAGKKVDMTVRVAEEEEIYCMIGREDSNPQMKLTIVPVGESKIYGIDLVSDLGKGFLKDYYPIARSGFDYQMAWYDFNRDGKKELIFAGGDKHTTLVCSVFQLEVREETLGGELIHELVPRTILEIQEGVRGVRAYVNDDNEICVVDTENNISRLTVPL